MLRAEISDVGDGDGDRTVEAAVPRCLRSAMTPMMLLAGPPSAGDRRVGRGG